MRNRRIGHAGNRGGRDRSRISIWPRRPTQVVPNAYPEPNTTLSALIRVAFDVSQTSPAMKRLAR